MTTVPHRLWRYYGSGVGPGGDGWVPLFDLDDYLPLAGGVISGDLDVVGATTVAEPTAGAHAATRNYVDTTDTTIRSDVQGQIDPLTSDVGDLQTDVGTLQTGVAANTGKLDELDLSGAVEGDVLRFNGSVWTPWDGPRGVVAWTAVTSTAQVDITSSGYAPAPFASMSVTLESGRLYEFSFALRAVGSTAGSPTSACHVRMELWKDGVKEWSPGGGPPDQHTLIGGPYGGPAIHQLIRGSWAPGTSTFDVRMYVLLSGSTNVRIYTSQDTMFRAIDVGPEP